MPACSRSLVLPGGRSFLGAHSLAFVFVRLPGWTVASCRSVRRARFQRCSAGAVGANAR